LLSRVFLTKFLFYNFLTKHQTNCMNQSSSWHGNISPVSQEVPAFYGSLSLIIVLTPARYLFLSRATSTQFMPQTFHFLKTHYNIILQSMPSSLDLSFFLFTPPPHFILLDLITRIKFGEEKRPWISSTRSLFNSPFTPSLLGPNTFLREQNKVALALTLSCWYILCSKYCRNNSRLKIQRMVCCTLEKYSTCQKKHGRIGDVLE
jgi:hypothetical protein